MVCPGSLHPLCALGSGWGYYPVQDLKAFVGPQWDFGLADARASPREVPCLQRPSFIREADGLLGLTTACCQGKAMGFLLGVFLFPLHSKKVRHMGKAYVVGAVTRSDVWTAGQMLSQSLCC